MVELGELIKEIEEGRYIIEVNDFINYIVDKLEDDKDLKDILILIREDKANYSKKLIDYNEDNISFSDRKVSASLDILNTLGLITVKGKSGKRIILYEITQLGELCLSTYIERIEANKIVLKNTNKRMEV